MSFPVLKHKPLGATYECPPPPSIAFCDKQFTDAYELDITVDKKDGDWRFSSFTVVEFMKK